MVNGFFTPFFNRVQQGCPLSAPLYVLFAESLACSVRTSPVLRGLSLPVADSAPAQSAVISQYKDDTNLFCTSDSEICEVFKIYDDFEKASGSKLNMDKSKGLWCGSWRGRTNPPVVLQWSSDMLTCLGVVLGFRDLSMKIGTSALISLIVF
jgi:hypothetical protein